MTERETYGIFATKAKAVASLKLWENSAINPYEIETDIGKIKIMDGTPETIWIRYKAYPDYLVGINLNYFNLNNGAGMVQCHRRHFGDKDENPNVCDCGCGGGCKLIPNKICDKCAKRVDLLTIQPDGSGICNVCEGCDENQG
jgi:hypothetical protein